MYVAVAGTDIQIVRIAIDKCCTQTTLIVGEDVDLLLLLMGLTPPEVSKNVYFLRATIRKQPPKIYSVHTHQCITNLKEGILIAHAISGCDTTLCFHRKGKINALRLICKEEYDCMR